MTVVYMDSSALAKLFLEERESAALTAELSSIDASVVTTSIVGKVEIERVARRCGIPGPIVEDVLDDVAIARFDVAIAALAGRLAPIELRSLDAIHLATARSLGSDLDVMYCYDRRLAAAAEAVGIDVRSPGAAA